MDVDDDELDKATLRAIHALARLWERPWPAFLDEFKELAAALSSQLHWHHACDA